MAHSGRAGTFKNIVKNVIESFEKNYKSNAGDIVVSIGAKINVCCYEVGYDTYKQIKKLNLEYAIEKRDEKYYLDIQKILFLQLKNAGIKENNIQASPTCSCCSDRHFSHRKDSKTGRFAGVIAIPEQYLPKSIFEIKF